MIDKGHAATIKVPSNLPKLPILQKTTKISFNSTIKFKQDTNVDSVENLKRNFEQRENTMHSQQRHKMTPKSKKSHKLLAPMVLDPYKRKIRNQSNLIQPTDHGLILKRNDKQHLSVPKSSLSAQRNQSKDSNISNKNGIKKQVHSIKKFKQCLKQYVQKKNEQINNKLPKSRQNQQKCNPITLNQHQQFQKLNRKRQILDKITMKGKYRCRIINNDIFQNQIKLKKSEENILKNNQDDYWQKVIQSDISFKAQSPTKNSQDQFFKQNFLKIQT